MKAIESKCLNFKFDNFFDMVQMLEIIQVLLGISLFVVHRDCFSRRPYHRNSQMSLKRYPFFPAS